VFEKGAALVETAFIAGFLVILALGIVDSAWLLGEQIEVRSAAREGGRFAATNSGDSSYIITRVCSHFDPGEAVSVSISGASGGLGDEVDVTVVNQVDTITGFLDWAFNPPVSLSSTSTFRIETPSIPWSDAAGVGCP
jgi:Flp pilus assembly protein TadG